MRLVWVAVGVCVVAAVAVLGASYLRGRNRGLEAAERDLARGTPCIRRLLRATGDIRPDGIGIDEGTGLPLSNTMLTCGTGVDFIAYDAENDAYNERIAAAHDKGDLEGLTLDHKLRTASAIRALFEEHPPVRLAKDGDRAETAGGGFVVTYRASDDQVTVERPNADPETFTLRCERLTLARRDAGPQSLTLLYPMPFTAWPENEIRLVPGPFDVLFVDDETTAILRDGNGFAWVVDLPRGVAIEVVGRIP